MSRSNVATIGADPEFFVFLDRIGQQSKVMPAWEITNGTKEKPYNLKAMGYNEVSILSDNVMLELNMGYATTGYDFQVAASRAYDAIQTVIGTKQRELKKKKGHSYIYWDLGPAEIDAELAKHEKAQEFGCEPDFNAYDRGKIQDAYNYGETLIRQAGGHIHIGGDFSCPDHAAVMLLELIGIDHYGVLIDRHPYCPLGSYRSKEYGVEIRHFSSQWFLDRSRVFFNKLLATAQWLIEADKDNIRDVFNDIEWDDIRQLYNECSKRPWTDEDKPKMMQDLKEHISVGIDTILSNLMENYEGIVNRYELLTHVRNRLRANEQQIRINVPNLAAHANVAIQHAIIDDAVEAARQQPVFDAEWDL